MKAPQIPQGFDLFAFAGLPHIHIATTHAGLPGLGTQGRDGPERRNPVSLTTCCMALVAVGSSSSAMHQTRNTELSITMGVNSGAPRES